MMKRSVVNTSEKPSWLARATGAVKRAAITAAGAVKRAAITAAGAVKRAAITAAGAVKRAVPPVVVGWRMVVRPVLRSWGKWISAVAWVAALLLAPLPVLLLTIVVGVSMLAMARFIELLDASDSTAARAVLVLIEVVGHAVLVVFYAAIVLDAVLFPPLAVLMIIDMAYRAHAARVVIVGEVTRAPAAPSEVVVDAIVVEQPEKADFAALRVQHRVDPVVFAVPAPGEAVVPGVHCAKGAEEMMDEPNEGRCHACGEVDECLTRSRPLPYDRTPSATLRANEEPADEQYPWFRPGDTAARARVMLCGECFAAECEEIALALTGVSLKATNVDVRLNERGLAATRACSASLERVDCLHWEPTAWWRDRKEDLHERAWTCFHAGTVVGRVSFSHKKRTYVAATSQVLGTTRSLELAKRLVNDELMDAGVAMPRMLQALAGMGEGAGAPAAVSAKAG